MVYRKGAAISIFPPGSLEEFILLLTPNFIQEWGKKSQSLIIGEKAQPLANSSGCDISLPHQTMTFFLAEYGRGLFSIMLHQKNMQSQGRAQGKTGPLFIPTRQVLWEWELEPYHRYHPGPPKPVMSWLTSCPGSQLHLNIAQKELYDLVFVICANGGVGTRVD